MEDKIIKSSVFDNETILNKTLEQAIDVDFSLPEYYPDIAKILKCQCVPYITSKGINGNTLSAEGVAVITVIYVDDGNMLNSYEYRYLFSKSFEVSSADSGICTCVTSKTDYINCRPVTARKIDVHAAVSVTAEVTKKTEKEIITDTDFDDVCVLCENISANTPLSCNEKSLDLEEEIEIGSAKKDINCIIRYSGEPVITESKLIAGKIMVKGELFVNLLYCNDDGEIDSIKETLPFGTMIESETNTENCGNDTAARLSQFEIKPKSDEEGKLRSFSVDAKLLLTSNTYCTEDKMICLDAYSRKYEITTEKTEMTFKRVVENINENFSAKQTLNLPGITKMIDLWCKIKNYSARLNDGILKADGVLTLNALYFDENNTPLFAEREIPFEFSRSTKFDGDDYYSDPDITVTSVSYLLSGEEEAEVKAELAVSGAVYECKRIGVLTDITVNKENAATKKSDCAMVVYFAEKGEKLWDIARDYLADVDEIKKINEIEDDILKTDKSLLIPLI